MKKPYLIIIFLSFASSLSITMQNFLDNLKSAHTVTFITENIAAAGTDNACHLIHNPMSDNIFIEHLYNGSIQSLITNKKDRLGILAKDNFMVYDIITKEKIWSQLIYNDDYYSAAFSYVDDEVFICQNGQLKSNKGLNIELPHTPNNYDLNISCHPKKNKILYICSDNNNVLAVKSLNTSKIIRYHLDIKDDDYICRAFYSPNGKCIGIYTHKEQLYIYYPSIHTTTSIQNPGAVCCNNYHTFLFLPHTDSIIAFICNEFYIHYWNIKHNKGITCARLSPCIKKSLTSNILDFSPCGIRFIINSNGFEVSDTHLVYLSHIIYKYWILKEYSLNNDCIPLDVVKLFILLLYNFFPFQV